MKWISVEDRLPENSTVVLAIGVNVQYPYGYNKYTSDPWTSLYIGDKWERWPHKFLPTHWMPIPDAPK